PGFFPGPAEKRATRSSRQAQGDQRHAPHASSTTRPDAADTYAGSQRGHIPSLRDRLRLGPEPAAIPPDPVRSASLVLAPCEKRARVLHREQEGRPVGAGTRHPDPEARSRFPTYAPAARLPLLVLSGAGVLPNQAGGNLGAGSGRRR